ncbi:hypothetical protein JST97_17150 [bacterium]|nr:hypothetical protein [bacterium]
MVNRKYRLTRPARPIDLPGQSRPTALVWVDAPSYDEDGTLVIECQDPGLLEKIRHHLFNSYGDRGRPLEEDQPFSPRDLACALDGRFMKEFEAVEAP